MPAFAPPPRGLAAGSPSQATGPPEAGATETGNPDVLRCPAAAVQAAAERFPTPFFLYEEARIRESCRAMKRAFAPRFDGFDPLFAVKANPNPHILRIVLDEGFGLDCSSHSEAWLARRFDARGMHTGNYTTDRGAGVRRPRLPVAAQPRRPLGSRPAPGDRRARLPVLPDQPRNDLGDAREQSAVGRAGQVRAAARAGTHGVPAGARARGQALRHPHDDRQQRRRGELLRRGRRAAARHRRDDPPGGPHRFRADEHRRRLQRALPPVRADLRPRAHRQGNSRRRRRVTSRRPARRRRDS